MGAWACLRVGDEDRVGALERLGLAPFARVDDQDAAILFQPDAGMGVLADLHRGVVDGRTGSRPSARRFVPAGRIRPP